MSESAVTFLVVEDDKVDFMNFERTMKSLNIYNPTVRAEDGVFALNMLRGEDGAEKISGEVIVFLDINLPRMGGIEFLKQLRADETFKNTMVFIMSTSESNEDLVNTHKYDISGYITKSDAEGGIKEAFDDIDFQWTVSGLPK